MEHPPNKWSIGKDTPIEWRYFNFKQKGLSGIFTYPLFNVGGVNKAYVASELYMGGKSYGGPKILKLSDVSIKKWLTCYS